MGKAAARVGDLAKQLAPHCHAMIHPPAPVPTPQPHPALPLKIMPPGSPNVKWNQKAAARVNDLTDMCKLAGCVPAGPGKIAMGSMKVMVNNLPAARAGDMTAHQACVFPVPSPVGKIMSPCSPNVKLGG